MTHIKPTTTSEAIESQNSAKVTCRLACPARKIWNVKFSGVLCNRSLTRVASQAIEQTQDGKISLIRLDDAIFTFRNADWPIKYLRKDHLRVVICRPDQMEAVMENCRKLAEMGIKRVVFLPHQLAQAQAFVQAFAAVPAR